MNEPPPPYNDTPISEKVTQQDNLINALRDNIISLHTELNEYSNLMIELNSSQASVINMYTALNIQVKNLNTQLNRYPDPPKSLGIKIKVDYDNKLITIKWDTPEDMPTYDYSKPQTGWRPTVPIYFVRCEEDCTENHFKLETKNKRWFEINNLKAIGAFSYNRYVQLFSCLLNSDTGQHIVVKRLGDVIINDYKFKGYLKSLIQNLKKIEKKWLSMNHRTIESLPSNTWLDVTKIHPTY